MTWTLDFSLSRAAPVALVRVFPGEESPHTVPRYHSPLRSHTHERDVGWARWPCQGVRPQELHLYWDEPWLVPEKTPMFLASAAAAC